MFHGFFPRQTKDSLADPPRAVDAWNRASPLLASALLLVAVLIGFGYVYNYGVNVPWYDEWIVPILMGRQADGALTMDLLWCQHNEHRILFPNLAMLGIGMLADGNVLANMYFSQILLSLSLAVVVVACRRQATLRQALWTAVPLAFLLFSLRQWENMLWGFQVTFLMVLLGALFAFLSLGRIRNDCRASPFIAAVLAATVAAYSSLQGIFVWPIGFVQLLVAPLTKRSKTVLLAIWSAIGAGEWLLYFHHWHTTDKHPSFGFSWQYFFTMLGSALCPEQRLALPIGVLLAALAATTIVYVWRKRQWPEQSFWLALMAFSLAIMFAITIGRTGCGLQRAMASRYTLYSILLVIAVYAVFALQRKEDRSRLGTIVSRLTLGLIVVSVLGCFFYGMKIGRWLYAEREYQRFLVCTSDLQPDEAINYFPMRDGDNRIVPKKVQSVHQWIAVMKRLNSGVFADSEWCARQQPPDSSLPEYPTPTQSSADRIRREPWGGSEMLVIDGWAIDSSAQDVAGGVAVVLDGKTYPAYYGTPKKDVAKYLGDPRFTHCGFRCAVLLQDVKPGKHSLLLKVQSQDRKGVFVVPWDVEIDKDYRCVLRSANLQR
jgi:hypothetical protein